ncbi:MAG TPA: GNAT family N-acetyltransferase [Gaiellaceae bacterium]|jgi:predicted N-acyltransferase|nr:GNAT family N-acetyltransferase [Gaiellaceae bacterium]
MTMATRLSVDVVTGLDGVAAEWDELAAGRSLYLDRRWLRSLEHDPALTPRYVLVRDAGRLVGALPAYVWDGAEGWATGAYDVSWALRRAVAGVARDDAYPAVLAGSRAGYANEPLLARGLPEELRREVAAALLEAVDGLADDAGASVVAFPFLTRRGLLELAPAIDRFGPRLLHSAGTRLEVQWNSFEGYMRSLRARRRNRTRVELRRFEQCGLTVERLRLTQCHEEVAPLSANVQRRYGHGDSPERLAAALRAQANELDDKSVVFLARRDGLAAGFSLAFEHERVLHVRGVGFDYEQVGGDAAYFKLTYYLPIEYAGEAGLDAIEFGPTAYRAKFVRGCRPYPLLSVVRPAPAHRDALAAWAPRWNESAFRWSEGQFADFGRLERQAWLPEPEAA